MLATHKADHLTCRNTKSPHFLWPLESVFEHKMSHTWAMFEIISYLHRTAGCLSYNFPILTTESLFGILGRRKLYWRRQGSKKLHLASKHVKLIKLASWHFHSKPRRPPSLIRTMNFGWSTFCDMKVFSVASKYGREKKNFISPFLLSLEIFLRISTRER